MRIVKLSLLVGVLLIFGVVGFAQAADGIQDGRVNSWEAGAPVAIYCRYSDVDPFPFIGVEVLRINAENEGELALTASAAEIDRVSAAPTTNTLIKQAGGYKLYRLTNGGLSVVTPPDYEGKIYQFAWNRGDQNC